MSKVYEQITFLCLTLIHNRKGKMLFLCVPFLLLWQNPLQPYVQTHTKTQPKKNAGDIYEVPLFFWGGGGRRRGGESIKRVIEVSAFCRLGLLFAAGAKTNDIIKKQVHTRFGFCL